MAEGPRERAARLIDGARAGGHLVLSEHDAKRVLSCYGIPGTREGLGAGRGGGARAAGLVRDADFGPCVVIGLGGTLTEVLGDVTFRKAPLDEAEALAMLDDIEGRRILDAVRGMPAADRGP